MDIQKEREVFEAWVGSNGRSIERFSDGSYKSMTLDKEWEAWQAAKAQAVPECKWSKNQDGFYDTSCTNAFVFSEPEDTPKDHDFTHCPFCGGKLSEPQEST
ncbi:hypothetical protein [Acinetobacter radioresistens]